MRSGAFAPPVSRSSTSATDLGALRREAEAVAKERGERATTTHVLYALATREGLPAELLAERRVGRDTLLKALRVAVDDDTRAEGEPAGFGPIDRLFTRARDLAGRARRPNGALDVDGGHVLLAICLDRSTAAHKTLAQLGVDVARLRGTLTQHLTGA
ncbi:MAG: hypothetical protein HYV09_39355, partial [Deltaproteobacteria bacterium]|nr:hypothetical protein [Deltaproteobacteria bacterium]